jgi:cation diffusion facilitator CzcD-associated flavoprotein CzcO
MANGANSAGKREPRVAVIGSGLSGIGAGVKLRRAGFRDFTIFEKADELGGTWRDNRYPGLACDIPSRYYSYSFAPNPWWSASYAPGPEIWRYSEAVARREGLYDHFRFGTEIASAVWGDGAWTVTTTAGDSQRFDFVISAVGFLHYAKHPDVPGLDSFEGDLMHSARWDPDVAYAGKRVGVIGNGSSGTQIVAAITKDVSRMSVFIRTPQWVIPAMVPPSEAYGRYAQLMERFLPGKQRKTFEEFQLAGDEFSRVFVEPGPLRDEFQAGARAYLEAAVPDPELRAKLTPDYEPGCKRIVLCDGFYAAVQEPQAEVVRDPIERVVPGGVQTADGEVHQLDVLITASGYDTQAFLRHVDFVGENGRTIEDAYAQGLRSYRSVALDGFPNLFILGGPHAPFGNFSFILSGEKQSEYAVRWIAAWAAGEYDSAAPSPAATDRFMEEVREQAPKTIWGLGCDNWYLDSAGIPSSFPWSAPRFRELMSQRVVEDFVLSPPRQASGSTQSPPRASAPAQS